MILMSPEADRGEHRDHGQLKELLSDRREREGQAGQHRGDLLATGTQKRILQAA